MGQSTNGQLCYGIVFDEGFEFPWTNFDGDGGELEDWWIEVAHGYKPPFECFDEDGDYLPGFKTHDPRVDEYFSHRRAFKNAHPLPVVEVNYCSGDYPMYILAVPQSCRSNYRGDPKSIDPAQLVVTADQVNLLLDFCKTHGIELTAEQSPQWWLSSYWG